MTGGNWTDSAKFHISNDSAMAVQPPKYDYVRNFEKEDRCLPNAWIVVRVDGKSFCKFVDEHGFEKPNDKKGLDLMVRAAVNVMEELRDVCLSYGHSDEFSFVFRKDTSCYSRQSARIMSTVNSIFTSAYVYYWNEIFGSTKLKYAPAFESVIVVYPSEMNLKDYLAWRQTELHAKNTYNTLFAALLTKGNRTELEVKEILKSTNQMTDTMFRELGLNYFNEPDQFRRGTTLIRKLMSTFVDGKLKQFILPMHVDLINDDFWKENPEIIGLKSLQVYHRAVNQGTAFLVSKPNHMTDRNENDQPIKTDNFANNAISGTNTNSSNINSSNNNNINVNH